MFKSAIDWFTLVLVSVIIYMVACTFHANITPTDIELMSGRVHSAEKQIQIPINVSDPETRVKRGDTLMLTFRIHRYVSGLVMVNRILIDGAQKSWIVSTATRDWAGGQVQYVEANYPIPAFVTPGCRALAFSQNNYSYRWNLLTYVVPVIVNSPKVQFCIE